MALFEWAHRFTETGNPTFTHPADAVAVDALAAELEWVLPEVFTEEYTKLLQESREAVVTRYRSRMGAHYSGWLEKLRYQDTAHGTEPV